MKLKVFSANIILGFLFLPIWGAPVSNQQYAEMRRAARERSRLILQNNDGCDVLYYPKGLALTRENFLDLRTTCTAGLVDTIFYCPISAGPGHFTVKLPSGNFLTKSPAASSGCRNVAQEIADMGEDPVQWIIDFTKQNKQEFFFSFRFNDFHDKYHRPDKPHFLFGKWKDQHRQWLFGKDHTEAPFLGAWSSVDFGVSEVRKFQVQLVKEVLDKYDVDGIDLDFSRYFRIFKSTADGSAATRKQRAAFTSMIRDIRKVIDAKGKERGKAILLSVVLMESVEFCRDLGYDIEAWMKEGLVDLWLTPDTMRLNTFVEGVKAPHAYGVKFYPQMGDPWPHSKTEKGSLLNRRSVPAYRARALTALKAGADGFYYYNIIHPAQIKKFMIRETEKLECADKDYFLTDVAWEYPSKYNLKSNEINKLPQMTSLSPVWISPELAPEKYILEIGDNLENIEPTIGKPEITAYVDRSAGTENVLQISSNGVRWHKSGISGRYEAFSVPSQALKKGVNTLELSVPKTNDHMVYWEFNGIKQNNFNRKRGIGKLSSASQIIDKNNEIIINDDGTGPDDMANIAHTFYNLQMGTGVFKFECRLINSNESEAVCFRVSTGQNAQTICIEKGRATLKGTNFSYKLNTAEFHKYELRLGKDFCSFSVDGKDIYRGNKTSPNSTDHFTKLLTAARILPEWTVIIFGSLSGKGRGKASWRNISVGASPGSVKLINLCVKIKYPVNHSENSNVDEKSWKIAAEFPKGKSIPANKSLSFSLDSKRPAMPVEIDIIPGEVPLIWIVSDGRLVTAWMFDKKCAQLYLNRSAQIDIADGEKHRYRIEMKGDMPALFKDGYLFYKLQKDREASFRKGRWVFEPETMSTGKFIAWYGKNFSEDEVSLIRKGGTIIKNMDEKTGKPAKVFLLRTVK